MGYGSGFLVPFQKPPNHGLLQLTPDPPKEPRCSTNHCHTGIEDQNTTFDKQIPVQISNPPEV